MAALSAEHPSRPTASQGPLVGRPAAQPRKSKIGHYALAALGLLALLGLLAGLKASQISMLIGFGQQMQKAGPPPEVVSTAVATEQRWESKLDAVASVVSAKGVAIANDAAGVVSRLHFESGATVKQGQILVELDTKVERAQLASARARRSLAQTSLERSRSLIGAGAISKAQLDTDDASFKGLSADAAALQAQIERKIIRAPFSGKLGMRVVNLGQYLAPGTTVAELESTDSTFVDFTLPQRDLPELAVGMPVRATQEGGEARTASGTISAIEPSVDPVTRSARVRATLPNQDDWFRPGMFVRVSVILPEQSSVVAIPLMAVVHASYGDSVFLVESAPAVGGKPGQIARQQFVKLGESRGDFVAVVDGVKAGQVLVQAGAFKLRNGAPIVVDNDAVKLDPKLAPRPDNR